ERGPTVRAGSREKHAPIRAPTPPTRSSQLAIDAHTRSMPACPLAAADEPQASVAVADALAAALAARRVRRVTMLAPWGLAQDARGPGREEEWAQLTIAAGR